LLVLALSKFAKSFELFFIHFLFSEQVSWPRSEFWLVTSAGIDTVINSSLAANHRR
jgi:hypothetical protein